MKHPMKFHKMKLVPIAETFRIALPYLVVGCLWIFFSDQLLLSNDAATMILISNVKGWVYVIITAVLVALLVYSRAKKARKYQDYLEESESRYRNLFYDSNAVEMIVDVETGSICEANAAACAYYGYALEEIKSKKIWDINTASPAEIHKRIHYTYENRKYSFEAKHRLANGEIRDVEVFSGRMEMDGRKVVYSIIHDITERKVNEYGLQTSEARLNRAQVLAHVGNWEIDLNLGQMWASEEAFRMYGIAHGSPYLPLRIAQDAVVEEDRPMMDKALQNLIENNERYDREYRIRRQDDGEIRILHSAAELEYGHDGKPARVVGVVQDITERKKAEEKIIESEKRYRNLFYNMAAPEIIVDVETCRMVDANPAACAFYGYSLEEMKTKMIWDINRAGEEAMRRIVSDNYDNGIKHYETRHWLANGECRDVEIFHSKLVIDGRKTIYSIVEDITERKQAERALSESENRFRLLVESAPDAVFVQTDYRFTYVNKKAVEIFGASTEKDLIGRFILDHFSHGFKEQVSQRIQTLNQEKKAVPLKEETIIRLDGEPMDVEVSAVPIQYNNQDGALVFMRDITERKNLEKGKREIEMQLRQKQKLESIGTLAGGVAHEINNPISGIINYAQLIAESPAGDELARQYSMEIMNEGQRVAGIVKNLLSFARQEKQTHSPADIGDIIERTVSLIRTVMRHDQIGMEVNIPEGLPSIKCRSQQIQQVLMNLFTNARDALNEKYKGYNANKKIILHCSLFERDGRRWIRILVEDHGTGIPEDIRDNIFDPFFTTKPRDVGTGLGLSISHGIVKDHHGELYFETRTGEYTRAILELPVDNGWTLE